MSKMACLGVAPAFGLRRLDSAFPLRRSHAQFPYPIGRRTGATICRWNTATDQDTSRVESQSGVKPPHSKASRHSSAPLAWLATALGTPIASRPAPRTSRDCHPHLSPLSRHHAQVPPLAPLPAHVDQPEGQHVAAIADLEERLHDPRGADADVQQVGGRGHVVCGNECGK